MRKLVVLLVVGLGFGGTACRKRVDVIVPNTPEGLACQRQCMVVYEACKGGRRKNVKVCRANEDECLETCPGAMFSNGRPARGSLTSPSSSQPPPPPPAY